MPNTNVSDLDTGIIQKTFNVAVISGSPVELFLIDDDPPQKSFFDKAMEAAHDKKILKFRIQGLMNLLRCTWSEVIDKLQ